MNGKDLLEAGLLDQRAAVVHALLQDGWTRGEANEVIDSIPPAPRQRQPYTKWTDAELADVRALIRAAGDKLPSVEGSRELAKLLGRTPKSVLSMCERLIRDAS